MKSVIHPTFCIKKEGTCPINLVEKRLNHDPLIRGFCQAILKKQFHSDCHELMHTLLDNTLD